MIETILSNFHLEKLWYIFIKNLAYMIIVGAIFGVAGGAYASMSNVDTYTAKATFYVYSNPDYVSDTSVNISGAEFSTAKLLVQSYVIVLKSDTVMNAVIEEVGLEASPSMLANAISYSMIEDTAIFSIYVSNPDPQVAMEVANAVADIAPPAIEKIVKSGGIEVVDYATLPTYASSSASITKFGALGFVGGFGLVLVICMLIGLLDTTIRRKYELRLNFNIPIIGDVPLVEADGKNKTVNKLLADDSPFVFKESYNSLRSNLLFTSKGEKCPVYAITSADKGEGKTLNSVNLAKVLSQMNKKVLLIDGDMRAPSVSGLLNIHCEDGLSKYLAGLTDKPNYEKVDDNLSVLSAGSIPPNPAELLASEKMEQLMELVKEEFDIVLIDMPPVGVVSDAVNIADKITSFIFVVRVGKSKVTREKIAITNLENVDADICGFIFNGIPQKSTDYTYYKYGYGYKYGNDKKSGEKK